MTGPSRSLWWCQRNISRASATKAHMAWKQKEMASRVFTVLGTQGFVLGAVPFKDKAASVISDTWIRLMETRRLQCVENVSVESATMEYHRSLSAVFPRLRALCEDPVHKVMKFKTANGNHASTASYRVSRVVAKFSIPSKDATPSIHALWQWQRQRALATTEFQAIILRHMSACDLPDILLRCGGPDRRGPPRVLRRLLPLYDS